MRDRLDRFPYPDAVKLAIARQFRRHPTAAERHAWSLLRRKGVLGLKFRRQHRLCGFIVDFFCPQLRLVLEIDGGSHDSPARADYDRARTERLQVHGYTVRRIRNADLDHEELERLLRPYLPLSR